LVSNLNAVVLKLGGSVITFKALPEKPNIDAVRRLSREIAEAGVERLVLVHGGGSFGHPMAQAYASRPRCERLAGLSATHVSMLRLNRIVVSSLLEAGVEAFPLHPSSLLRVRGGRVETLGLDLVQKLLDVGLTPVLYGDVVPDLDGDLRVVSGDVIASTLAVELEAERLIFCLDVDGIHVKEDGETRVLDRVRPEEFEAVLEAVWPPRSSDATGGMRGKLLEAFRASRSGVSVLFVNGLKPGLLLRALRGEEVPGTVIG